MTSNEKKYLEALKIHKERLAAKKRKLPHKYVKQGDLGGFMLVGLCQCDECKDLTRRFRLGYYGTR
jgi:hypothetical protein